MIIVTDTREKRPYQFKTPSQVGTLPTGDYSLAGLENHIAVERKTLDDLIGCLCKDRDRFTRELLKGKALDYFALVVEAGLSDLANGNYRSEMNPKSAVQSLLAFSVRYKLPIFFCESRAWAQRVTESLLLKYAKEIERNFELIKDESAV